ncbi:MAG: FKBP-type peptidyl-prolyl cis-trans isomerase [Owenweeksia sp.]
MLRKILPLLILVCMAGCQCSGQERNNTRQRTTSPSDDRIQAQRDFLKKERKSIQSYISDRKLEVMKSGTGLYYSLLEDSTAQMQVNSGDEVLFEYDIYMLNGSLLYSSEENKPRLLLVDKEDAEIGLHESLKLLGLGDKGLFILPSHLAFGVAGDQNKVPPKTALVYELKILKIIKSKS